MATKTTLAERLAKLEAKQKTIEVQRKALEARLGKQERARDTRRKVLLGAFILHHVDSDSDAGSRMKQWLAKELPGFLTRDNDKALFPEFVSADNDQRQSPDR